MTEIDLSYMQVLNFHDQALVHRNYAWLPLKGQVFYVTIHGVDG